MSANRPRLAIMVILLGILTISINDVVIKFLSGAYPLHQMVFVRSAIGIVGSFAILIWAEGGLTRLKTRRPALHLLRALLIVAANMTYFAGLAVLPISQATAVFFVAPLFITLLSIPVLGESVGLRRLGAVAVGFLGVAVMLVNPDEGATSLALLLPVAAAAMYAGMQILTRKLGADSPAAAMAIYLQGGFIAVSVLFWLVAGDGRYLGDVQNPSLQFLLRPWVMPEGRDLALFALLGVVSTVTGWALSQAYRLADASTVAPFEYAGLPLAIAWGWLIWGEMPGLRTLAGIALIAGAGLVVFLREQARDGGSPTPRPRPTRR